MKISIFFILLAISFVAHAHQYIQCANLDVNSSDRVVINLDGEKSTLFMTSGLGDPEEVRILKSIKYVGTEGPHTIYRASDHLSTETLHIPTNVIGNPSQSFQVSLELRKNDGSMVFDEELLCFSAIYND